MLPSTNSITKKYITKVLVPELLKNKHDYDIVRYDDRRYVELIDNGTYIMFSGCDVFISPCNEFGVLCKENGKAKRYNNLISESEFVELYNKARVIKTEEIMKEVESLGVF